MFDIEKNIFSKYELDTKKLDSFGFCQNNGIYSIDIFICSKKFKMTVLINKTGTLEYKVYDTAFYDEYTLYKIDDVSSEYVNRIRDEIESKLLEIRDKCYSLKNQIYKKTNFVIFKIFEIYGVKEETPWKDDPYDRVFRNKDTNKWFALIMRIDSKRIGLDIGEIECMNVKLDPIHITSLIDNKHFFKAYHMNKKYWMTILLDDTLDDEILLKLLDESFLYSNNKKR